VEHRISILFTVRRRVMLPVFLVVLLSSSLSFSSNGEFVSQSDVLHRCYEIEIGRIEETYRLLDAFAVEIWPGWSGYLDISFQVAFPNKTFLLINPGQISAKKFVHLTGRTLRGKAIYIDKSDEVTLELKPPLTGGGGGSRGVRIRLRAREVELGQEKKYSSDEQILLYIHELFHGFQNHFWRYDRDSLEGANGLAFSKLSADCAAWLEIECRALLCAFLEKDKDRSLMSKFQPPQNDNVGWRSPIR
jgi:hypothetical protein